MALTAPSLGDIGTVYHAKVGEIFTAVIGRARDVTIYGAVGNGVADDTAAIQAAIDAGAGVVWFPAGTYKVSHLDIVSNVTLCGVPGASILAHDPAGAAVVWNPVAFATAVSNIVIRDLVFQGVGWGEANNYEQAIHIAYGTNVTVENCQVLDFRSGGVQFVNGVNIRMLDNYVYHCGEASSSNCLDIGYDNRNAIATPDPHGVCVFRGNFVQESETAGICVGDISGGYQRVVVEGNVIRDCDWAGIAVEAGYGRMVTIANNIVTKCLNGITVVESGYYADEANDVSNVTITGNVVDHEALAAALGIYCTASRSTIVGNTVTAETYVVGVGGGNSRRTTDIVVANNTLTQTAAASDSNAMLCGACDRLKVEGNILRVVGAHGYHAIYLNDCTDTDVSHNRILGATIHAIDALNCPNIAVSGNVIRSPGNSGIVLEGNTVGVSAEVSDNFIDDAAYGILAMNGQTSVMRVRSNTVLNSSVAAITGAAQSDGNIVT
jgi:hypothetical protein